MGLSVPIVSGIMLVALVIVSSMVFQVMVMQAKSLAQFMDWYASRMAEKLEVALTLNITSIDVSDGKMNLTLRNVGSKTVFLENNGVLRNDVIVAYNSSTVGWISQTVNYTVLEVRIANADVAFNSSLHPYLSPGEEALIQVVADGVESGSIVVVVFVSHYGVATQAEGVAS